MFKVGEFSRLAKVTIETLRHYDAVGLLKPAAVDPFTGYRYYSAKQLLPLNRILALKELGFSLQEISCILQEDLTNEQLRAMLRQQLVLAERDVQVAQSRVNRIKARLNYLYMEDNMPVYEVNVKPVEAVVIASIRQVVPTIEDMPAHCSRMFDTIAGWLSPHKVAFGPSLTVYYNEGYTRKDIDTECAFVITDENVAQLLTPPHPITFRQLEPIAQAATTIITDGFYKKVDGLTPAYNALAKWIEANGYVIVAPPRELFHGSAKRGDLTAEIQFPIERVKT